MYGDVRASPKEINLFLVWLQCQGRVVSEATKLDTLVRMCSHPTSDFCKSLNYWVSSHTSNFSKNGQSDPDIRRWGWGWGARAHVQRCPTPPMTCGKQVLSDPQPTYQIWTQSAKPFLRYRSAVCTCARAEIPPPMTCVKHLVHDLQLTHQNWTQSAEPFLRYRSAVCTCATCRDTPSMTCVKHLVHGPHLTHQNWTQSAEPFLRYRSAVCTCARAEIPHPWLLHEL